MRMIFGTFAAVGIALAVPAAPALAQAQAGISVGTQVTDASGAPVGSVTAIEGTNLKVKTDKHEALLPRASFRVSGNKLVIGLTQAQLDSEIEKNLAAANAAIAAGATAKGAGGTPVGTIEAVADGKVAIALQKGSRGFEAMPTAPSPSAIPPPSSKRSSKAALRRRRTLRRATVRASKFG